MPLKSDLIRLAHENPELRRHLLPLLKKAERLKKMAGKSVNYHREVYELRNRFLKAMMQELGVLMSAEGFSGIRVSANMAEGTPPGQPFPYQVLAQFGAKDPDAVDAEIKWGRQKKWARDLSAFEFDSAQMAAQVLYKHFHGFFE